jgi:hypothetical protein
LATDSVIKQHTSNKKENLEDQVGASIIGQNLVVIKSPSVFVTPKIAAPLNLKFSL